MAVYKRKRERSREQIMEAARSLFEERGIKHVTFNDIADRAQMCRTTIFNHFATTNDLMLAIVDSEAEEIMKLCEESDKEGLDLIYALFNTLIDEVIRYPHMSMWLIAGGISTEGERSKFADIGQIIMDNLPGSKKEKERRKIQFSGLFYGLINHHLVHGIEMDPKKVKKQFEEYTEVFI